MGKNKKKKPSQAPPPVEEQPRQQQPSSSGTAGTGGDGDGKGKGKGKRRGGDQQQPSQKQGAPKEEMQPSEAPQRASVERTQTREPLPPGPQVQPPTETGRDDGGKGKGRGKGKGKGQDQQQPQQKPPGQQFTRGDSVPRDVAPASEVVPSAWSRPKGPSPPSEQRAPPPGFGAQGPAHSSSGEQTRGPAPGMDRRGPPAGQAGRGYGPQTERKGPGFQTRGPPPERTQVTAAAEVTRTHRGDSVPRDVAPASEVVPSAWSKPKGPSPPSEQRAPPPGFGAQSQQPYGRGQTPGAAPGMDRQGPPAGQAGRGYGPPKQGPGAQGPSSSAQGPPPEPTQAVAEVTRTHRDPKLAQQVRDVTQKLSAMKMPTRADINKGGTVGRNIVVETNHLALDLSKLRSKIAIHYDVQLDPDKPRRLLRLAMEAFRLKHYPKRNPAYDGRKNLVSAGFLPFGDSISDTVQVRDEESQRDKEYKVTIKFAAQVDLTSLNNYMYAGTSLETPQTAIQMIDIVLRNAPAMSFVPVGRSYFTPPTGQVIQLGDGMEIWYGLFQSVNLGWRPFVNVDVAHKGFPTARPVIEVIKEFCSTYNAPVDLNKELNEYQKKDLGKFINKLKIDYMIPGQPQTKRTYRVNEVVSAASKLSFSWEGAKITIQEYFRSAKNINLKYPHMPCLHVGSLNRPNPIYLPVEFCTITMGQAVNRLLNERQTANMVRAAATSTDVRKQKIRDALNKVKFNSHPAVNEFGLTVGESFTRVPARILPPPELTFREGVRPVNPQRGVWKPAKFYTGKPLSEWVILNLDERTREDSVWGLVKSLQKSGDDLGMQISEPRTIVNMRPIVRNFRNPQQFNQARGSVKTFFEENKGKQLILVIVPDKGDSYANVKQLAELNVGVLTQCVKARTVYKMNFSTASNILLKINSKLNGVNHIISRSIRPKCLSTPAILVGADVTHPSPQQKNIPSVAAVCASHDPNGFCYNIQFKLQPAREEIIVDLQEIMRTHLLYFYRKTSFKPNRILFFRDGVSEGQFFQVQNAEISAIRRACGSLDREYKPAITFLVVQKRHHTRFFPTRQEDADGRNCNVPAGTIVDTEITHPTEIDFYLVSHASIQGVSRPTKYHCLCDDNNMSEDELQQLTYFLCHMFSRCTRSVSYPAPTYYAHLAAYRARVYIEGREIPPEKLAYEQTLNTIKEEITKNSPMFFV